MNRMAPRAVYALWKRDVIKMSRYRSRLLSGLAQPLMYLLVLGAGLDSVFRQAGYGDYRQFLTPGITAMAVMTTAFVSGISVLWDRRFGFLKETLIAPISRFNIVLGRALGASTIATVQGCLVLAVSVLLGGVHASVLGLFISIPLMFLCSLFFAAAGIWFGAIIEDFQSIQLIVNFILMPLFFLSGALFPLPSRSQQAVLRLVMHLDPVTYCVDILRGPLGADAAIPLSLDLGVIFIASLCLLVAGGRAFERVQAT